MEFVAPYLTEADPVSLSEGSLDPLGLYVIADRLALTLVPGFRERMSKPGFFKAIAAGSHICSQFNSEYASDGISPAYLVYEWHVVQALIKTFINDDPDQLVGLPGREKATDAYEEGEPLSFKRYLVTPNVFGFHGVYRTLVSQIDIIDADYNLGETGYDLIKVWEEENKMQGFLTGHGIGRNFYSKLKEAVDLGMEHAHVKRTWNWDAFKEIANVFNPNTIGSKEGKVIYSAITRDKNRKEIIDFLCTENSQLIWKGSNRSERRIHDMLLKSCSVELKDLLIAIQAYESFCRYFQNAFDACLVAMSQTGKSKISDLSELDEVIKAAKALPGYYHKSVDALDAFNLAGDFQQKFGELSTQANPKQWLRNMFDHHKKIQRTKGKIGKRLWFEMHDDGMFEIYSSNMRNKTIKKESYNEYLHGYRTTSLYSFLEDLNKVKYNG